MKTQHFQFESEKFSKKLYNYTKSPNNSKIYIEKLYEEL